MNTIYVSIYASVLATIVFLWRLFEYFEEKRGRFYFFLGFKDYGSSYGDGKAIFRLFVLNVTNVSKKTRYIHRLNLLSHKGYGNCLDVEKFCELKMPLKLEPGEILICEIPFDIICNEMPKSNEFYVEVQDTHFKQYYSESWNIEYEHKRFLAYKEVTNWKNLNTTEKYKKFLNLE
jgi:hypothetical protein